jgi:hypothetical protein
MRLLLRPRQRLRQVQSLIYVRNEIGRMFDAYRQPDRGIEYADPPPDVRGHPEWVMLAGKLASDSVPPRLPPA